MQLAWLAKAWIGETEDIPEDFLDWHTLAAEATHTVPIMLAYEIAASTFNRLLAVSQQQGRRLKEKKVTGSALQRAVAREMDKKINSHA